MSGSTKQRWRRWAKAKAGHVPLLLLVASFLWTGNRGVDFGEHWDDVHQIDAAANAAKTGVLLPHWYHYSSGMFDVSMIVLATVAHHATPGPMVRAAGKHALLEFEAEAPAFRERLEKIVRSQAFLLRLRRTFLWIAAMAGLGVYLSLLAMRRDKLEAWLGAATLLISWEVSYHSRWIAPDCVVMAFGSLVLAGCLKALHAERPARWLVLGAVAGGVAFGFKYTAGILLIPLLLTWASGASLRSSRGWLLLSAVLGAFGVTFLVTTPGAVLEPFQFLRDVVYEVRHYREAWGPEMHPHLVEAGYDHAQRMVVYLALVALSPYRWLAALLFGTAVVGGVVTARRAPTEGLILLVTPTLYVAYMADQRLMVARNLLLVIPFLAILVARGLGALTGWVGGSEPAGALRTKLRWLVPALAVMVIVINAQWSLRASQSIRDRNSFDREERLAVFLESHVGESFCISHSLAKELRGLPGNRTWPNARERCPSDATRAVFYAGDLKHKFRYRLNRPGQIEPLPPGPYDINVDYYLPLSDGKRILFGPVSVALATGAVSR